MNDFERCTKFLRDNSIDYRVENENSETTVWVDVMYAAKKPIKIGTAYIVFVNGELKNWHDTFSGEKGEEPDFPW
jgi:hypothetical protein